MVVCHTMPCRAMPEQHSNGMQGQVSAASGRIKQAFVQSQQLACRHLPVLHELFRLPKALLWGAMDMCLGDELHSHEVGEPDVSSIITRTSHLHYSQGLCCPDDLKPVKSNAFCRSVGSIIPFVCSFISCYSSPRLVATRHILFANLLELSQEA